jgi:plasmid maintenance system killer protein
MPQFFKKNDVSHATISEAIEKAVKEKVDMITHVPLEASLTAIVSTRRWFFDRGPRTEIPLSF